MASKRRIEQAEQMISDVQNKIEEEFEELKICFEDLKYKRFKISTYNLCDALFQPMNFNEYITGSVSPDYTKRGNASFLASGGYFIFELGIRVDAGALVYNIDDALFGDINVINNCALRPLSIAEIQSKWRVRDRIRDQDAIKQAPSKLAIVVERVNNYIKEKYNTNKIYVTHKNEKSETRVGIYLDEKPCGNRFYEYFMDACILASNHKLGFGLDYAIEVAKKYGVNINWNAEEIKSYGEWKKKNNRKIGPDTTDKDRVREEIEEDRKNGKKESNVFTKNTASGETKFTNDQGKTRKQIREEEKSKNNEKTLKDSKIDIQPKKRSVSNLVSNSQSKKVDKPKKDVKVKTKKTKIKKPSFFSKIKDYFSGLFADIIYFFKNLDFEINMVTLLPVILISVGLIAISVLSYLDLIVDGYDKLVLLLKSFDGHIKFMFYTGDIFSSIRNWMGDNAFRMFLVMLPLLLLCLITLLLECILFVIVIVIYYLLKGLVLLLSQVLMWLLAAALCGYAIFLGIKSIINKENRFLMIVLLLISIAASVVYYITFYNCYMY